MGKADLVVGTICINTLGWKDLGFTRIERSIWLDLDMQRYNILRRKLACYP